MLWDGVNRLNYIDGFVRFKDSAIDLDFWQEEFVKNDDRFVILNKSRRAGFSFSTALKGLAKALDPEIYGYTKQFVSYNEDDAIEKIDFAKQFYESIPNRVKKELISSNTTSMTFLDCDVKSVSRLISTACRPPRGKGGDIALDEFAFYPLRLADLIYTAALPVISRDNGKVEIGSTPMGLIGKFAEIWSDKTRYKQFTRMTVPWWFIRDLCVDVAHAVKSAPEMNTIERVQTFGTSIINDLYSTMGEEEFKQEYECYFVDSAVSYFPLDLIHQNTPGMRSGERESPLTDDEEEESQMEIISWGTLDEAILSYKAHYGVLYAGFDVARKKDKSALFVGYVSAKGTRREYARIELSRYSIPEQVDFLKKAIKNLPIVRLCIDGTGLGTGVVDYLAQEFKEKIESVIFTQQMKEILAMSLHYEFEKNIYEISADKKFHSQIHAIQKTPTSGGHFRFDGERSQDGHQDSFWALALFNYAIGQKQARGSRFYSDQKDLSPVLKTPLNQNHYASAQSILRRITEQYKK